jgi:hypothetical protein
MSDGKVTDELEGIGKEAVGPKMGAFLAFGWKD